MKAPRPDKQAFEPEQYLRDLAKTAELIEAPHNPEICEKVVSTFEKSFSTQVLQWKATDRSGDGLYYRFLSTDREDIVKRCCDEGLLNLKNEPLLELQREALATFPQAVRSGVDFEAAHGLAKVWTYLTPLPLTQILKLRHLPEAVKAQSSELEAAGLNLVGFLASDFLSQTMNVYFAWHPAQRNRSWLESMLSRSNDRGPAEDTFSDMLDSQDEISGIGMTFDWHSTEPLRWCVYCFAVPFGHANPGVRVPQLSPRLTKLRDESPSLNHRPSYHMAWSYGPKGPYMKLEKNYAKDVDHFLATERSLVFRAGSVGSSEPQAEP